MKSLRSTLLVCSVLLSGSSVQSQTAITPPSQTTNAPCSPIFNGSNNIVNCNYPPGARVILLSNAKLAIAELKKLPGSRVEFTFVGGTDEINRFGNTVAALFREGQWTAAGFNSVGRRTTSSMDIWIMVKVLGVAAPGQHSKVLVRRSCLQVFRASDPHIQQVVDLIQIRPMCTFRLARGLPRRTDCLTLPVSPRYGR
jgi:hypothetical protein